MNAARNVGVRNIVFMSLLGAEKNPVLPHRKIENLIAASGMKYTFLQSMRPRYEVRVHLPILNSPKFCRGF